MTGPRLSIIPARACTDPALQPRDLQVLCVLGRHTDELGWCRPSQVKMAAAIGCARSTVFAAISRLVAAGYVERHVHEEANGRDSPHSYRVILDPVNPNVEAIAAEDDAGTPADIPAPPAGISAPPAGPGPAPKNDPLRTIERDAREDSGESKKSIEAEGWALLKNWPGFDGMPKEPAMAVWRTLSAEERATARRRFLPWLELLRKQKKSHVPAPSTYLKEQLWKDVPDPADAPPAPPVAPPFGKLFGVLRMALLLSPPAALPRPSAFIANLVASGGEAGERERLRHQATHGWPEVNRMHEAAATGRGWTLARGDEPPAGALALMEAVPVNGERWQAWQALHEARGWPWLPDPGRLQWVHFPAGGPAGLEAFEQALRGETTANEGNHDDADRHQAAE